jgi:hypothetical protein
MDTEIITVQHRATIDGQDEARHDAQRCMDALRKRFPGVELFGTPGRKLGTFIIKTNCPLTAELKAFAEGFMASAHLWER